jgi:hypothetical protein
MYLHNGVTIVRSLTVSVEIHQVTGRSPTSFACVAQVFFGRGCQPRSHHVPRPDVRRAMWVWPPSRLPAAFLLTPTSHGVRQGQ